MARDITEEFEIDLSNQGASQTLNNSSSISYDVSIGTLGFLLNNTEQTPYRRQTAQYKKEQSDNNSEVGEQSLSGWWLRSQSSFHYGSGMKFYEPVQQSGNAAENQTLKFRFDDSQGVDVWSKGEVSLLNDVIPSSHLTVGTDINQLSSIPDGVLLFDGYDVDKIYSDGTFDHFIEYQGVSGAYPVYSVCDDGLYAYWVTNASTKWQLYKKPLSGDSTTGGTLPSVTGDVTLLEDSSYGGAGGGTAQFVHMNWIKERLLICINNKIYTRNIATATGTTSNLVLVYTAASPATFYTSSTASGNAVYVAYRNGIDSGIMQITLDPDTLDFTVAGITAEMPRGEIINSVQYYLGFVAIGTNRGVRIAQVLDNGSLVYGPLLWSSEYPCNGFAASDRFIWCATGVGTKGGLVRVDLSTQLETLVFPYANDLIAKNADGTVPIRATHGVAFMGDTNMLAFTTPYVGTTGEIYIQDPSTYVKSGYITTGRIRYNTLDNKLFKFIAERALYDGASEISVSSISRDGTNTVLYSSNSNAGNSDGLISPTSAQEFLQFKFTLSSIDNSTPHFYGYQLKSLPAAKRQRLIQYPVFNYDVERDRYNNEHGYEGRAYAVIVSLEQIEERGDAVTIVDYRTNESYLGMIEDISYIQKSSPDRRYSGFGGELTITVRKI